MQELVYARSQGLNIGEVRALRQSEAQVGQVVTDDGAGQGDYGKCPVGQGASGQGASGQEQGAADGQEQCELVFHSMEYPRVSIPIRSSLLWYCSSKCRQ